jgi:hypothetical protein
VRFGVTVAHAPVDVGQLESADLDAAQPQVQRQADDGVATARRRHCIREGAQQPIHFLGLEASRFSGARLQCAGEAMTASSARTASPQVARYRRYARSVDAIVMALLMVLREWS